MMWIYLCIFLSIVTVAILATDEHFSLSNFFMRYHDHSVAKGTVGEPEPEVMEGHGEPEKNFRQVTTHNVLHPKFIDLLLGSRRILYVFR